MSGLFGVVSTKDCCETLFYGTDYNSHLGTEKAGLAVLNRRLYRSIHDISTRYQSIKDMVKAIGLPAEKLCLHCWNGK